VRDAALSRMSRSRPPVAPLPQRCTYAGTLVAPNAPFTLGKVEFFLLFRIRAESVEENGSAFQSGGNFEGDDTVVGSSGAID